MTRGIRSLARLVVGLFAVAFVGFGSSAYASVPLPDPVSDGIVQGGSGSVTSDQGMSLAQGIGWLATGALAFLLIGVAVAGIAWLSKRHRVQIHRLQMP